MSKLELRVSLQYLPDDFDQLEAFVAPDFYRPLLKNSIAVEFKQKRCKIIQDVKRQWLVSKFDHYHQQYEQADKDYRKILQKLVIDSSTSLFTTGNQNAYQSFMAYIKHHTERLQQEFAQEKLPSYRKMLQRLYRRRSQEQKKLVDVSPLVMTDLLRHPFTLKEMAFLSRGTSSLPVSSHNLSVSLPFVGPSYIRPNQSSLQSKKKRVHYVDTTVDRCMRALKDRMSDCKDRPAIPSTASIYKSYADRLRQLLLHCYLGPLPLLDHLRAERELKWITSIRRKLRKHRLILRETDKSGVLHVGRSKDYIEKAMKYHTETGAYQELPTNPFDSTLTAVIQLLNRLRSTNRIKEPHKEKMLPQRDKVQLAYMYFLPKPHKVTPVIVR